MFTGLVELLGTVRGADADGTGGKLLRIAAPSFASEFVDGESVAVNGACLTVTEHDAETCVFQASPETLKRTNLGEITVGNQVNLERSLRFGARLGGHLVQGHVDGLGRILERRGQGHWELFWFHCPRKLARSMVSKGSVAVDGVSLTLVDVKKRRFSVALIPHTLAHTTLGFKQPGDSVNLETDLIGKYVVNYLKERNG